ncbi:MAG: sensor histidine kinase, partial [Chloroflexota bacterium]
LQQIAMQAGPAVHAVQLTAALQASRRELVTAREEERRRLRRDLHDGLGAALAGLHLQAGAVRRLIDSDPHAAEAMIDEFRSDIRSAIAEIRRLVYELRPPMLDQLGLAAAVRAQATQCNSGNSNEVKTAGDDAPLHVEVNAPEEFPPLPAAVEVAAYRIVQEALTNALHHAQARRCRVSLQLNGALKVEIIDDGVGLDRSGADGEGLGLLSMRERAAELGGSCKIEPARGGGTRVFARLPLSQDVVSPEHAPD